MAKASTSGYTGTLQEWTLTPSQKALALYFAVVALLFLAQTALGGVLAHYRVEPDGFYGFDLAKVLPYNLARTWHLQLAIFWIATSWVAGGLFLAPLVGGGEPKGQKTGVIVLLGALAVVVFGSLFGEMAGDQRQARFALVLVRPPGQSSTSIWAASGSCCSPWDWCSGCS